LGFGLQREEAYCFKRCVLETLGEYLKSKREARNVTLEEIAEATRIRKAILVAIENDRQDLIPPRVFTQGFLKSYASYLELDESDVIKRYQETLEEREAKNDEEEIASQPPPQKLLTPIRMLVLFVIFILALASWFFKSSQENKEVSPFKNSHKKEPAELLKPSPVAEPETVKEEDEGNVIETDEKSGLAVEGEESEGTSREKESEMVESEQMVLKVVATEQTWIKFQLDQNDPFDVSLKPGELFRVKAEEKLNLRIGNAGGVELFFNEKPLGNPGKRGEVIDLTLPE
jgi:cytoskeleton protein RodZ